MPPPPPGMPPPPPGMPLPPPGMPLPPPGMPTGHPLQPPVHGISFPPGMAAPPLATDADVSMSEPAKNPQSLIGAELNKQTMEEKAGNIWA